MSNSKHMLMALTLTATTPVMAHHSSVMYDETKMVFVEGTVAKVEWENPHITIWAYVPNAQKPGGHELYGFQSGSINLLTRQGWTKNSLKSGEKIKFEYYPLKDGRPGGSLFQAVHADGTIHKGDALAISFAEMKHGKPEEAKPADVSTSEAKKGDAQ